MSRPLGTDQRQDVANQVCHRVGIRRVAEQAHEDECRPAGSAGAKVARHRADRFRCDAVGNDRDPLRPGSADDPGLTLGCGETQVRRPPGAFLRGALPSVTDRPHRASDRRRVDRLATRCQFRPDVVGIEDDRQVPSTDRIHELWQFDLNRIERPLGEQLVDTRSHRGHPPGQGPRRPTRQQLQTTSDPLGGAFAVRRDGDRGRQDLYPAELQLVRVDRTSRGGEQRDSVPTASERDDQVMDPDAEALIEGTRSIRADHEHASSIGRRHVRCCVQRHIPLRFADRRHAARRAGWTLAGTLGRGPASVGRSGTGGDGGTASVRGAAAARAPGR